MKGIVFSAAAAILLLATAAFAQPQLTVQGQPHFSAPMVLSVTADDSTGELIWLGVGVNPLPLDAPLQTGT